MTRRPAPRWVTRRPWQFPPALLLLALGLGLAACDPDGAPADAAGSDDDTAAASAGPPADTLAAPARDTVLEAALREATAGLEGDVGVAVRHLQREARAAIGGDRRFLLASVYKLPIAYAALMGDGLSPDDSLTVDAGDRAPGDTPFTPGTTASVRRLVERALARSDNTASDVLLRAAGGPEAVTRRIRDLGIDGLRVDRPVRRIFEEWHGAPAADDHRDTGTVEAVVALLAALHRGEGLSAEARDAILAGMRAADTGPDRIRAGLPEGTAVAHKTGTLGPLSHDVGLIPLPDGGDVALAVLIRSDAPLAERERVIADVARAVWERFAREAAAAGR